MSLRTTRTRILDAAAAVLREKGMTGTKLSEIGQRAGMLAPSLYYHFASKEQLVEEVMLEGIYRNTRHIVTHVEILGATASSLVRLETAITAHINFLLTGDDYSSAVARVFAELPEDLRRRVLSAYSSFDNYWRDLIVAMQKSGDAQASIDPTVARKFLIAMLNSSPEWFRPGKLGVQQIARQACDIFLRGFGRAEK